MALLIISIKISLSFIESSPAHSRFSLFDMTGKSRPEKSGKKPWKSPSSSVLKCRFPLFPETFFRFSLFEVTGKPPLEKSGKKPLEKSATYNEIILKKNII